MNDRGEARARSGAPLGLISRGLRNLYSAWVRMTYPFASMGSKVSIHFSGPVKRTVAHRITLGSFVTIEKDACLAVSLSPKEFGEPVIVIEDHCVIHWRSQIDAKNHIHLERDVIVSQDVLIKDHGHTYEAAINPVGEQGCSKAGRIQIGQGSWIAQGAAIVCTQGELVLGRNCVVTSNALVTKSAPAYSVLSGNPARVIKRFDPVKNVWVTGSSVSSDAGPME
jgi:acetyltransferase-like isoleucine patch superfamily enzyme